MKKPIKPPSRLDCFTTYTDGVDTRHLSNYAVIIS